MKQQDDELMVFIGRRSCGCVMAWRVDSDDEETKTAVLNMIRDGLEVKYHDAHTAGKALDEKTAYNCPHQQVRLGL